MFAAVALFAVFLAFLGTHVARYYEEQAHIDSIRRMGAQVFTKPRGPFLLRQFIGDSLFQRAVYVHLNNPGLTDDWLENLRELPYVEAISIKSEGITDAGLEILERMPNLRSVDLVNTETTEEGVEALRAALPKPSVVRSYYVEN